MGILLGLAGLAIIVVALMDLLWTVFLEGAGPISTRLCHWLVGKLLDCRRGRSREPLLMAGLLTVSATMLFWTILFWVGWGLIFCASPTAIVSTVSTAGAPADAWARFYYAGYTLTTLGLGDFRPNGHLWELATDIAGGSGFLLVGLAIAYIVPVVQAATQKRQLAVCIWSLGKSPTDIIFRAWNGIDTSALGPHLVSLTAMLALLGESHLTYPVLHYFHSRKRSSSVAPRVAALDEALTILECGLQRGCSLDLPSLGAAREAITEFLETLRPALIGPAREAPPLPTLAGLRDMGVPVVTDDLFETSLAALTRRRQLLLALVHNEGWTWDEVWPPAAPPVDKPTEIPAA